MQAFIVFAAILSAVVAAPQFPEFYSIAQDPRMLPMPQVPQDMLPQEPRAYEPYYAPQQYEPQYQPQYQAPAQTEQLTADGYKIVPGIVDARCPRGDDPMKPVHLPVHGNCAKFMKCFGGRAYEMDCPSGLEFGSKVNRCDYPAMAQCSRF
ncbi:peritrophin-1-like [Anopheles ziemanni]|uniref:peritrophin-1-like n=1 Tax=Anopheles coustani TaxID=139045 RepID=UPI0026597303|nr:peritrophin-1-like [Anopheles coustani]XP_058170596.1 peritrophin-1-like [Anopheles ziemanni]